MCDQDPNSASACRRMGGSPTPNKDWRFPGTVLVAHDGAAKQHDLSLPTPSVSSPGLATPQRATAATSLRCRHRRRPCRRGALVWSCHRRPGGASAPVAPPPPPLPLPSVAHHEAAVMTTSTPAASDTAVAVQPSTALDALCPRLRLHLHRQPQHQQQQRQRQAGQVRAGWVHTPAASSCQPATV